MNTTHDNVFTSTVFCYFSYCAVTVNNASCFYFRFTGNVVLLTFLVSLCYIYFAKTLPLFVCPPVQIDKVITLPPEPIEIPLADSEETVSINPPIAHSGPGPVNCRLISYELREGQVGETSQSYFIGTVLREIPSSGGQVNTPQNYFPIKLGLNRNISIVFSYGYEKISLICVHLLINLSKFKE